MKKIKNDANSKCGKLFSKNFPKKGICNINIFIFHLVQNYSEKKNV